MNTTAEIGAYLPGKRHNLSLFIYFARSHLGRVRKIGPHTKTTHFCILTALKEIAYVTLEQKIRFVLLKPGNVKVV